MVESHAGLRRLIAALNNLGVPFFIGGSLASSIHGVPRATMDVDLVVDLRSERIEDLATELGGEFYVDVEALRSALQAGRSFNLIHFASSYKFDLFPLVADRFQQTEFGRREMVHVDLSGTEALEFPVATAEDTILSKLSWYRAGGEASTRQWDDILGILRARGSRLDVDYLREWARYLRVEDLFQRALAEVPKR
jgi:hypothetical protein